MRAESGWVGTAAGVAVGMLSWVVGLGNIVWPEHPQLALLMIAAGVSLVSMILLERNDRRVVHRAQN